MPSLDTLSALTHWAVASSVNGCDGSLFSCQCAGVGTCTEFGPDNAYGGFSIRVIFGVVSWAVSLPGVAVAAMFLTCFRVGGGGVRCR